MVGESKSSGGLFSYLTGGVLSYIVAMVLLGLFGISNQIQWLALIGVGIYVLMKMR